jgi:hypothetical protein
VTAAKVLFDCRHVEYSGNQLRCPYCGGMVRDLLFIEGRSDPVCRNCRSKARKQPARFNHTAENQKSATIDPSAKTGVKPRSFMSTTQNPRSRTPFQKETRGCPWAFDHGQKNALRWLDGLPEGDTSNSP